MNEDFDKGRLIVHRLRGEGLEISFDGESLVVTPISRLQDDQRQMLAASLEDVCQFLVCENAVDQFLYVRKGGF